MRLLTRPLVSEIKEDWERSYHHKRDYYDGWTALPYWQNGKRFFLDSEEIFKGLNALDDSATIEQIDEITNPYRCERSPNSFKLSLRGCNECGRRVENVVELQDDGEYGCDHICKNCLEEGLRLMEGV